MDKTPKDKDTMWVVTGDPIAMTRGGGGIKQLKVEEQAVNINLFIEQMGRVLEQTPEKLGKFHFDEFEVHANITGPGLVNGRWRERTWLREAQPGTLTPTTIHKPCITGQGTIAVLGSGVQAGATGD